MEKLNSVLKEIKGDLEICLSPKGLHTFIPTSNLLWHMGPTDFSFTNELTLTSVVLSKFFMFELPLFTHLYSTLE